MNDKAKKVKSATSKDVKDTKAAAPKKAAPEAKASSTKPAASKAAPKAPAKPEAKVSKPVKADAAKTDKAAKAPAASAKADKAKAPVKAKDVKSKEVSKLESMLTTHSIKAEKVKEGTDGSITVFVTGQITAKQFSKIRTLGTRKANLTTRGENWVVTY